MKKQEQSGFNSRLLELRKRLLREVDSAEESLREDVVKTGEISSIPTHPADQDVEGLDAEIGIAQNEELLLEQVEAALGRIESGTFGVCQQCKRTIDAHASKPFRMRHIASIAPAATPTKSKNRCEASRDASVEFANLGLPIKWRLAYERIKEDTFYERTSSHPAGTRASCRHACSARAGLGLLMADCLPAGERKAVGWTLLLVGALSTVPLAFEMLGKVRTSNASGLPTKSA